MGFDLQLWRSKWQWFCFSVLSPSRFYTPPPDPVPWVVWGALYKTCPFIPAPALAPGGRRDCAMILQILSRKPERLCSIKAEGAGRWGAQQCLLPTWLGSAERAAIGHRGASLSSNQSWWTWEQNNASSELCQIPQIAAGQETTSAVLWNKIQTYQELYLFFFPKSAWVGKLLKAARGWV